MIDWAGRVASAPLLLLVQNFARFVSGTGIRRIQQENENVDCKANRVFLHPESYKTATWNQALPGDTSFGIEDITWPHGFRISKRSCYGLFGIM